jgi:hypothetical protein
MHGLASQLILPAYSLPVPRQSSRVRLPRRAEFSSPLSIAWGARQPDALGTLVWGLSTEERRLFVGGGLGLGRWPAKAQEYSSHSLDPSLDFLKFTCRPLPGGGRFLITSLTCSSICVSAHR